MKNRQNKNALASKQKCANVKTGARQNKMKNRQNKNAPASKQKCASVKTVVGAIPNIGNKHRQLDDFGHL